MTAMPPASSAATIRVDEHGFVTAIDEAFETAFGWSPATLVGRPLTQLIPPTLRDAHNLGFSRFLSTGESRVLGRPLALEVLTPEGATVAVEIVITAERDGEHWAFAAALRRA